MTFKNFKFPKCTVPYTTKNIKLLIHKINILIPVKIKKLKVNVNSFIQCPKVAEQNSHMYSCQSKRKSETFLQAQLLRLCPRTSDHSYNQLEHYASPASVHHFFPQNVYDKERITNRVAPQGQITFENDQLVPLKHTILEMDILIKQHQEQSLME